MTLRASFEREVDRALAPGAPVEAISDEDLGALPPPVQIYLRRVGTVGQPRVRNFHARMHGRFRNGRGARWMPFTAEQFNFFDEPSRLFYMRASMRGIPACGYHRYVGGAATMEIRVAGLVPIVKVSGIELSQGETVTMFNDMCVMAPATLIDPAVTWEALDDRTARARFTNAGHTIQAQLSFNDAGELVDFVSDDRYQTSPDGKTVTRVRWSTPLSGYCAFGPFRLASGGEARWHEPEADYAYIALAIDDVRYNVGPRGGEREGEAAVVHSGAESGRSAAW